MSFDDAVLRRLAGLTALPLVRLLDRHDRVDGAALDALAGHVAGLGVHHELVRPRGADGRLRPATGLVGAAHRRGLGVHVWTLRAENRHLAREHRRGTDPAARGDHRAAVAAFLGAGVDGVITDHPGLARA